jgi:antitoxin (DNA-binding transcriptional repressor) of toxin-antitoxin stability system
LADVKNDLSRFVALVRRGARVRILVRGIPAADLVPVQSGRDSSANDEVELNELETLGLLRRGAPTSAEDNRELDRPGPRVRGSAVGALIAERRAGR